MDELGNLVERFDHVAYAVRDVEAALPLVELMEGEFLQGADHRRNGFRWVQFRLPGSGKLELLAPITDDSFLHRFLERRGEGVHHLTFKVTDVEAAAARAAELGFEPTGLHLHPVWSEVFLHPKTAHGTVVQLAAWTDNSPWEGSTLEDVLAGRSIDTT